MCTPFTTTQQSRTAIHGFGTLLRCWFRISITTRRAALHCAIGARQPQSDSALGGASTGLLSHPVTYGAGKNECVAVKNKTGQITHFAALP